MFSNLYESISFIVYFSILGGLAVFAIIICAICNQSEKEYLSQLNEHDKSVVLDYKARKRFCIKKRKKEVKHEDK